MTLGAILCEARSRTLMILVGVFQLRIFYNTINSTDQSQLTVHEQ